VGEKQNRSFQLCFNGFLKVDFQGSRVTSDGGLILIRELDEHLGMNQLIEQHLTDSRRGKNTQLPMADLLRQSVYSRLAGYEDVNDAERVSADPTFRLIGSEKIWDRGAALTSRLHSFETELLAEPQNLAGLRTINRELIAKAEAIDSPRRVVLDIDSTEIPVYGQQEDSAYNGHFESTCYHPLLLFNREGDCLAAKLRPGNVHSADDWEELLLPEIPAPAAAGERSGSRADAAFANRRSTRRSKSGALTTPFVFRLTTVWNGTSPSCCRDQWGGPASSPWSSTRVFSTRLGPAEWWPKWSITRASCSRE
jgi:hypothetical protein